jgi:hypothetical protein
MNQRVHIANAGKFRDPAVTADGSPRATVALTNPTTLWFNTGTLCNIACTGCYIESSPLNDRLDYITAAEMRDYLGQVAALGWPLREIGFTGGEPFMNPEFAAMMRDALAAGFDVLVLTNAMRPMMRPQVQAATAALIEDFGGRITFRVSLDHWTEAGHDAVRGAGSFVETLAGMRWLGTRGARLAVAGRARWSDPEAVARAGYGALFAAEDLAIDPHDPAATVIFPEMDENFEVPEITTACWGILGISPDDVMCASSRMVVKRKGRAPSVVACTLLPYTPEFDLGATLAEADRPVALNHPHCARFCVLGGASCSA